MNIQKLDPETINLISAGEVIESPCDVVKELIENAIDSGADSISLTVKDAGLELLEIKDNGCGIKKEDLLLCLEKHTTSKLKKIDDLFSLDSFGFRGEALSSINAISKLSVVSAVDDNGKGTILENNALNEIEAIKGTTITVKDLFYNVPVRKKFLKSKSVEFSKIYDVFLEFVLFNPNIKFTFISSKKTENFFKTTQENRFLQVFGKEFKNKVINVDINNDLFSVKGFLMSPVNGFYFSKSFIYINKRAIFSSQINKIVLDSYKDYLMIQQRPFFILFFEINKNFVDINVHPKKRIIKIQNEQLFLAELKLEISRLLDGVSKSNYSLDIDSKMQNKLFSSNTFSYKPDLPNNFSKGLDNYHPDLPLSKQNTFTNDQFADELRLNNKKITKIFGQINNTYIICEVADGFILIDQHAAAERINLEKNRKLNINLNKQELLTPKLISNITFEQKALILKNENYFLHAGFSFESKDDNLFLKTIPVFLDNFFDLDLFLEMVFELQENPKDIIHKLKDKVIKLKSCKESLKANSELSLPEIQNLIKQLDLCVDKNICAHGRPTNIFYSIKDLEKLFKRIV